jgi:6,7-dimethyl-8-ribityllumazine synthase
MPVDTVRLPQVPGAWRLPTIDVHLMRDRLKVVRVDAVVSAAEVI